MAVCPDHTRDLAISVGEGEVERLTIRVERRAPANTADTWRAGVSSTMDEAQY